MSALQHFSITDSLHLSCIRTDRFKTGVITLTLCLPLTRENALLNMLLPGVLRRGTERYPDMASLNRRLDELYAACVEIRSSRIGKNLALVVCAEVLDEAYAVAGDEILSNVIEVLAEMLLRPRTVNGCFDEAIVRQELRFSKDSIRSEINNTRSFAAIRCMELMHRNDPTYPTLKEMEEQIDKIDAKALFDYYRTLLSSASLQAFYIGSMDPSAVAHQLRQSFEAWHTESRFAITPPIADPSLGFIRETISMPVAQGKLAMGFRTGVCADGSGNEIYTAIVFNELLGDSPASKLFLNVREKMSLCYYCSSYFNRYTGILMVCAGIESKNRAVAEQAILEQLESIRRGEISETEMRAAKLALANAYRQIADNPFELQSFYSNRALFGSDEDIADCMTKFDSVTVEQIQSFAQKVLYDTVFFIEGTNTDNGNDTDEEEPFDE